jgi:hypothetical protein
LRIDLLRVDFISYGAVMTGEADKPAQAAPKNDEAHRRRVFLIAVAASLVLLGVLVWLVQMLVEQQRIERCTASRRPDCFRIDTPVREAPVELKR